MRLRAEGGGRAPAATANARAKPRGVCGGRCTVVGLGAGVVLALFSQEVMTCRLAEPARTGCRSEGGSVPMPLHSPGLRSRGLRCRLLALGPRPGQCLAAAPRSG